MKKKPNKKLFFKIKSNPNFKKFVFFFKIFLLILTGFLPSFLFTILFVQYGSPLTNYIQFISNLKSSWIAWVSAIIIVVIGLFIRKISKSKFSIKKISKNKTLFVTLSLCLIGLFFLILLQSYLYVNFLLKNDILVKLYSDKTDIFFTNNSQEEITFQISVTSNPFCSSECNYSFFDLSSGKEIEEGSFLLNSISTKFKNYILKKEDYVEGSQTLKRFEVSCKSKKSALCYTKGKESKRSILISENYRLTENQSLTKEILNRQIQNLSYKFYNESLKLDYLNSSFSVINNSFYAFSEQNQYYNLLKDHSFLNESLNYLKNLWANQKFDLIPKNLDFVYLELEEHSNKSSNLEFNLNKNIENYNFLLTNSSFFYNSLNETINKTLKTEDCEALKRNIILFNNFTQELSKEKNLSLKKELFEELSLSLTPFFNNLNISQEFPICSTNVSLSNFSYKPIYVPLTISNKSLQDFYLQNPMPICCFYNDCEKCCEQECQNSNYPVLFLHGHSVNKKLPADYSLDVFNEIKSEFVKDKYIDAGAIILGANSQEQGLWGKINRPIMVTGSYFFDTYKAGNNEISVSSTTESIDTYAIRLNKLVELVKTKTNKDKVIIVAHSMGGLVARRYIQIFGGESIDKLVLITVPNHGIQDKIKDYCGILGSEIACKEMDKQSTFIYQLNKYNFSQTLTYNVIGVGCNMGKETGDGVLTNSSQYLDYAKNYYISGKCDEFNFDFLHESIMYPEKYPEIYDFLKKIL